MKSLRQAVSGFLDAVDQRSRRERLLLLAAACASVIFVFVQLVHTPLQDESRRLRRKKQGIQKEIHSLEARAERIVERSRSDPNQKLRRELRKLQREIASLDERLRRQTVDLVSPSGMARILEEMLRTSQGLELLSLENLDPAVLDLGRDKDRTGKPGERGASVPLIYRHPLRITFVGDYLHTLEYLERLEDIEQRFFWDRLEFEVEEHPRARITLTVHTLSLNKRWVGI